MKAWNPRFVNYARVHGRTPEEQLAHDAHDGEPSMCGFILWNGARLNEWMKLTDHPKGWPFGIRVTDHENYDKWLSDLPVGHGVEVGAAAVRS